MFPNNAARRRVYGDSRLRPPARRCFLLDVLDRSLQLPIGEGLGIFLSGGLVETGQGVKEE